MISGAKKKGRVRKKAVKNGFLLLRAGRRS
jgi:hypothetical protein